MPPSVAPDSELWAIVAHLRSISVMPPLVSTGNVERGRALFAAECSSCHQVRGEGGAGARVDRDQTVLAELRIEDLQHTVVEIDMCPVEAQCFTNPDPRYGEQANDCLHRRCP